MYLVERWVLKNRTLYVCTSFTHHRIHKRGKCGTEAAHWTILTKAGGEWYLVLWTQTSRYLQLRLPTHEIKLLFWFLLVVFSPVGFPGLFPVGRISGLCWEERIPVVQAICSGAHLSVYRTFQTRRARLQDSHLGQPSTISLMDLERPSIATCRDETQAIYILCINLHDWNDSAPTSVIKHNDFPTHSDLSQWFSVPGACMPEPLSKGLQGQNYFLHNSTMLLALFIVLILFWAQKQWWKTLVL